MQLPLQSIVQKRKEPSDAGSLKKKKLYMNRLVCKGIHPVCGVITVYSPVVRIYTSNKSLAVLLSVCKRSDSRLQNCTVT
uniref:Uncharacterized protein n=1 Tax=Arion vulgaris TaxID=1028688 RepID=A0A0B6ZSX1_9EUPU